MDWSFVYSCITPPDLVGLLLQLKIVRTASKSTDVILLGPPWSIEDVING